MDTSFLRRLSASPQRPLLPQHEPHTSSTYSLHTLPPTTSAHSPYPSGMPTSPPAHDPPTLRALHRQESHLQQHLQALLDAQSEGLLAGLARPTSPASSATGSRTPTGSVAASKRDIPSSARPAVVPVRQPVRKPVGLGGARRGIARALRELRGVKAGEAGILDLEVDKREEALRTVRGLGDKRKGLEEEIRKVEGGEGSRRVEGLKEEKRGMDEEVRVLEEKLAELRAQAAWLGREIAAGESERESRVSSFREALRGLDVSVGKFLKDPPGGEGGAGGMGVRALPAKRRTLELCREEWEGERDALVRQREGIEKEQEALDEGLVVWEGVVGLVAAVEGMLRGEMGRLGQGGGEERMRGILERMAEAVRELEDKVQLAQTRGWNLLLCAIGAELEAFREGRDVLQAALDAAGGNEDREAHSRDEGIQDAKDDAGGQASGGTTVDDELGRLALGGVRLREYRVRPPSLLDRSEDEDDGPGPELLTSHQEEEDD